MRTSCFVLLSCCAAWFPALALSDEPAAKVYVMYGGEVRDGERVIGTQPSLDEPLAVVEERPDSVRVTLNDGSAGWIPRTHVGTLSDVLQDASRQIAARPDEVELRFFRAQLAARRNAPGDREQALADLEHFVRLSPRETRGYLLRGSLWAKTRQFEAAVADFSTCLKLDPACSPALLQRGLALYALRDYEGALADFEAHVQAEPKAALGYTGRAMAHVELGQHQQAEADFSKAIAADDKSAMPWFERARMWMRRHDAAAAVNDLSETLQRDPKHLDAMIFLATLLACGPDDTPRNGKRAVELATAACRQTAERDFRAMEALAAAQAEAGDFVEALAQQEKALALLEKSGASDGAKAAARQRLGQYKASQPVRLMR